MVQSLEGEAWRPLKGYEGLYEVSNFGRVKSLSKPGNYSEKLLKQRDNGFGYYICQLMKDGKRRTMAAHRAVAFAFIPNPDKKQQVNHKDGNRRNNVVDNLEWCSNSENQLHKFRVLGYKAPGRAKRKIICCETGIVYNCAKDAATALGLNKGNIFSVASHRYGFRTAGGYHWEFVV